MKIDYLGKAVTVTCYGITKKRQFKSTHTAFITAVIILIFNH